MRLFRISAAVALVMCGMMSIVAMACPVDVASPVRDADLRVRALDDAFVQYLGAAQVIRENASNENESPAVVVVANRARLASSSAAMQVRAAPTVIPLPAAAWSGLVGLGALGLRGVVSKIRRSV